MTNKYSVLGFRLFASLSLAAVLACGSPEAIADIVRLRNGGELWGQVDSASAESLTLTTESGTAVTVPAVQVHFLLRRSPLQDKFERKFATTPSTAEAHWELGQWAKQNRLHDEYRRQLKQVLIRDGTHSQARRILGYVRERGQWRTREQSFLKRGYVKVGRRFITRAQRDSVAKSDDDKQTEVQWVHRIVDLAGGVNNGEPQAVAQLRAIQDPLAISGLTSYFREANNPAARKLYVEVLGRIPSEAVVAPLVDQAILDPTAEVRTAAMQAIPAEYLPRAAVIARFYLKAEKHQVVQEAARLLGGLKTRTSIEPLVESLVTLHDYSTRPSASPTTRNRAANLLNKYPLRPEEVIKVMQTGLMPKGATAATDEDSDGRVQAIYPHRNTEVLAALVKITGEDFGFDQRSWRLWLAAQKQR